MVYLAGAAFVLSLMLPAFLFQFDKPLRGMTVLLLGWWGLITGEVGWFGNLAFFYALWATITGHEFGAKVASTVAFILALTSFHAKEWYFSEAGGTPILSHGSGFYMWLFAFLILLLANWLFSKSGREAAPSGN